MRFARFFTLICSLLPAIPLNAQTQTQRQPRFDFSVFSTAGQLADDFWGFDASYRVTERVALFGTLTVVDTAGASGWMADGGVRSPPGKLWRFRFAFAAGLRMKHLRDAGGRSTRLRGVTETRISLLLGPVAPYYAVRYPWFDWKDADRVWGLAVVW